MNIKKHREKLGLSQRQLAFALNLVPQSLNRYETGKIEPDIETLIKLADYFNISIDELLERESKIINLNFISEQKQNLINDIINASDNVIDRLEAYMAGIKYAEEERNQLIERIKRKS